jgi:hypothetical protein
MSNIIIVNGFTPESFYQEIETEQRCSSTTREEFLNEKEAESSSIDFQAIYNAASDISIMQKFIDRHDKMKNSSELKLILTSWLNGQPTPSNIQISNSRVYNYKAMYFLFIHNRYRIFNWSSTRHNFADFSKWLKKRSRS